MYLLGHRVEDVLDGFRVEDRHFSGPRPEHNERKNRKKTSNRTRGEKARRTTNEKNDRHEDPTANENELSRGIGCSGLTLCVISRVEKNEKKNEKNANKWFLGKFLKMRKEGVRGKVFWVGFIWGGGFQGRGDFEVRPWGMYASFVTAGSGTIDVTDVWQKRKYTIRRVKGGRGGFFSGS